MILQVHDPNWPGMAASQPSGLGCSCGGQCEPCKMGLKGVGDWSDDLMTMLSTPINLGFVSLPVWAVGGVAILLAWWMLTPGGSDYRRARRQLSAKYRGSARLKRAASSAAGRFM